MKYEKWPDDKLWINLAWPSYTQQSLDAFLDNTLQ